jgi:hypothetical protein
MNKETKLRIHNITAKEALKLKLRTQRQQFAITI